MSYIGYFFSSSRIDDNVPLFACNPATIDQRSTREKVATVQLSQVIRSETG